MHYILLFHFYKVNIDTPESSGGSVVGPVVGVIVAVAVVAILVILTIIFIRYCMHHSIVKSIQCMTTRCECLAPGGGGEVTVGL